MTARSTSASPPAAPLRPWRRLATAVVAAAVAWPLRHAARRRQRRALLRLDERLLRDIGITRAQVEREARWPF